MIEALKNQNSADKRDMSDTYIYLLRECLRKALKKDNNFEKVKISEEEKTRIQDIFRELKIK